MGCSVLRFIGAIVKVAIASLLAGAALSFFGITYQSVFAVIGVTPEQALEFWQRAMAWAIPNMILGAMLIVPAWLLIYLFLPPRSD